MLSICTQAAGRILCSSIPLENINLAELERRTGLSRSKLRALQAKGFKEQPHGLKGKPKGGILKGYTGILDSLLSQGITNSVVCLERLRQEDFTGGRTTVKDYIAAHKYLVPVRRTQTAPQGNRGRRYMTGPGEAFQMDWGFTKVLNPNGAEYQVACFAMICHHCGQRYVEFFPNARQENLFIGMIHAFQYRSEQYPRQRFQTFHAGTPVGGEPAFLPVPLQ